MARATVRPPKPLSNMPMGRRSTPMRLRRGGCRRRSTEGELGGLGQRRGAWRRRAGPGRERPGRGGRSARGARRRGRPTTSTDSAPLRSLRTWARNTQVQAPAGHPLDLDRVARAQAVPGLGAVQVLGQGLDRGLASPGHRPQPTAAAVRPWCVPRRPPDAGDGDGSRRCAMKVVVAYGSKRGGTEGLATMVADALRCPGHRGRRAVPPGGRRRCDGYDAVVVGRRALRRPLAPRRAPLRAPAPRGRWRARAGVAVQLGPARRLGDRGRHRSRSSRCARPWTPSGPGVTSPSAGACAPRPPGSRPRAMAKTHAGDWRDPGQVAAWVDDAGRRHLGADAAPSRWSAAALRSTRLRSRWCASPAR